MGIPSQRTLVCSPPNPRKEATDTAPGALDRTKMDEYRLSASPIDWP